MKPVSFKKLNQIIDSLNSSNERLIVLLTDGRDLRVKDWEVFFKKCKTCITLTQYISQNI